MLTEKEFGRLSLNKKYQLVKKEATYLGARLFESYNVKLFGYNDFYIEVWYRLGLNQIYWIEVLKNKDTLKDYADQLDLKDLGLDL